MSETPQTVEIAQQAFEHFRHGLATGEWEKFIEMLSDDFTFSFPAGPYQGLNEGKERMAEFLRYVSEKVFSQGLLFTLERMTYNETTVVFEGKSEGLMFGKAYQNQVAISFDVRGEQISSYREYLSLIYKP
jgi:ketosteroid isomerase-like protein